jgi:hypothetical protein
VADRVQVFDAYPRNSAEAPVDVVGKTALFDALIDQEYDLAIDLRTDPETRFLLRNVQARVKAGIGIKAHFPWLDIALPVQVDLGQADTAWALQLTPDRFGAQSGCRQTRNSILLDGAAVPLDRGALIWGPYHPLAAGDYLFETTLEFEPGRSGAIACDIGLDVERVAYQVVPESGDISLRFINPRDDARFEFRLWSLAEEQVPNLRFYGGRLSKRGAESALHQSELGLLLVELVALRVTAGLFGETDA